MIPNERPPSSYSPTSMALLAAALLLIAVSAGYAGSLLGRSGRADWATLERRVAALERQLAARPAERSPLDRR